MLIVGDLLDQCLHPLGIDLRSDQHITESCNETSNAIWADHLMSSRFGELAVGLDLCLLGRLQRRPVLSLDALEPAVFPIAVRAIGNRGAMELIWR